MRLMTLLCTTSLLIGLTGYGHAGDEDTTPGRLIKVNFYNNPGGKPPWNLPAEKGDLIQYFAICSVREEKDKLIRTFKVEITGDAALLVGVVEMPVIFFLPKDPNERVDTGRRNISCFLKAVKEGNATLKLTAVTENGKELVRELVMIKVRPRDKPASK